MDCHTRNLSVISKFAAEGSDIMLNQPIEFTIRSLSSRGVLAPMPKTFVTASGSLTRVPLLLVDLHTDQGITGRTYLFSPSAPMLPTLAKAIDSIGEMIKGRPCAPADLDRFLEGRFLLLGGTGLVTMARAALDMAAWDAMAQAAGQPLATLWGGRPERLAAYESSGLGMAGADEVAAEAISMKAAGFTEMKLRLGYPTLAEDIRVAAAVREAVGPETGLMVDYNQSLTVPEAIRRGHALEPFDLLWIEEPTRADDPDSNAKITADLRTAVQIGENFFHPSEVQRAITQQSCDMIMPDVMKIGGATRWLRAAALADAANMPISSHLFPEISAHLLSVAPTRHFLEYVNWAAAVLKDPAIAEGGFVQTSAAPGAGIEWDEAAVQCYLI
jgi:mandelate racemase